MDVLASLPAFLPAVLLISASPGPAMALILRRAALRGTRAALRSADAWRRRAAPY
jgi:threonine/homoserine/homoserine lactone efflux protein